MDGTIRLWNLATQRELASFNQKRAVFWLAFSPDNQMLISGVQGSYQVWRAPRSDTTVTAGNSQVSLADLPANSIWRIPDGPQPLPPRMAGTASTLKVGDPAPKLQTGQWLQGEPVREFSPGKAYLVDFWAARRDACMVSIPHLNEIHNRYKDKGLVVIGQNSWEEDDIEVAPFIKTMGKQMTYRVALDDKKASDEGKMVETWLAAAGRNGIPTAFLVDTNGRIAWIGPTMELKEPLIEDVLSGTFDLQKAATQYAQRQRIDVLFKLAEWLAQSGKLAEAGTNCAEALDISRKLNGAVHPDTLLAMQGVASIYCSAGRGKEAISLLAKACELDPKDTAASLRLATWQAWFGQDADYEATRRRLVQEAEGTDQAGTAERAAKAACLRPSADTGLLAKTLDLARRGVELGKNSSLLRYYQLELGLAEYRNDQYADAEKTLAMAEQKYENTTFPEIRGTARLFRAMSLFRQDKPEEARKVFSQTEAQMPALPEDESKPLANGKPVNHDVLICWLAYKEARSLLNEPVRARP
jgi:tetratricopeptide (TPR) repeat protein